MTVDFGIILQLRRMGSYYMNVSYDNPIMYISVKGNYPIAISQVCLAQDTPPKCYLRSSKSHEAITVVLSVIDQWVVFPSGTR